MTITKIVTGTLEFWQQELNAQLHWIAERGGDLAGYIERYGPANDPDHFGAGGELIYEADFNRLKQLEAKVQSFTLRPVRTYRPVTPLEKLRTATELLADVAQVLAGEDDRASQAVAESLKVTIKTELLMIGNMLGPK